MKTEILISTMNLKDEEDNKKLLKKMNINSNSLTINQITDSKILVFDNNKSKNRLKSYKEKGLSKSRNKAIENAKGEICIIADDDVTYVNGYSKIIEDSYRKYKDADIIAFYVESTNKDRCVKKQLTRKSSFHKANENSIISNYF